MRILLVLLLTAGVVYGQKDSTYADYVIPAHAVKFSPLHLINFYPTAQVAYEFRIARRLSLQADFGYVINWDNFNEEFLDKRGFKVKLEPHLYLRPSKNRTFSPYLAIELYYNHVDFDRKDRREECFDLDCDSRFLRDYRYTVNYRESGFGFKFGFVKYFDNFFFDLNSGFAIRFIDYNKPPLIRQFNEREVIRWFDIPIERDRIGFMPLLCFRIGYRIK